MLSAYFSFYSYIADDYRPALIASTPNFRDAMMTSTTSGLSDSCSSISVLSYYLSWGAVSYCAVLGNYCMTLRLLPLSDFWITLFILVSSN